MAGLPNRTLIVICGPTAVGKTDMSIRVAERFSTAIVSADSRQVYREMPIGTAQPSAGELAAVPHHLVASRSVRDPYSAGRYAEDALSVLAGLFQHQEVAVLCGGTGLYIKAVCEGMDDVPPSDAAVRSALTDRLSAHGLASLTKELERLDPEYSKVVDKKNPQRVMRALEACIVSGRPYSSFRSGKVAERPFATVRIGLTLPTDVLGARIDRRVDAMMDAGWLAEAEGLWEHRHLNALNTVGYKELFQHLEGKFSLEEAVRLIKLHTRQFAKRQMTWFKKDAAVTWARPEAEEVLRAIGHSNPRLLNRM